MRRATERSDAEGIALREQFGVKRVAHSGEVGYKVGQWLDVGYWQVKLDVEQAAE